MVEYTGTCGQCMGSGFGGHPDSGITCAECGGSGGEVANKSTEYEIEDASILAAASHPLRVSLLNEAARLTSGERNNVYGEPVANHQQISEIFNAITGRDLSAREVALMHVATKLARLSKAPTHRDSHVDAMGYLGIVLECAHSE